MPEPHRLPTRRSSTTRRTSAVQPGQRAHALRVPAGQQLREPDLSSERTIPSWLIALTALVAWAAALGLLLAEPARLPNATILRIILPLTWALAAAMTFIPLQHTLGASGLGWQGIVGWTLLGHVLAFVPAPTGSLLVLPELPSYLLLYLAVFYSVATAAVPLAWLFARRRIADPFHQVRRARRQSYELAMLVVIIMVLAALRVLTLWALGILILVTILIEALLVSRIQTE